MPTSFTDQFFTFDPANPPPVGAPVNVSKFTLVDQNDDGDVDEFDDDAVAGLDVTASWPGDTVTVSVPGEGNITYTGTTLYVSDGSIIFTPTDGQTLKAGDFASSTYVMAQGPLLTSQLGPPCFTLGTRILTPSGQVAVEKLKPGDEIISYDHGPIELLSIRMRYVSAEELYTFPRRAPVVIPSFASGTSPTESDLVVSPQHRVLIRSKVCQRMFGTGEVLSPAAQLVGFRGIRREKSWAGVLYLHLLFDHHAIIFANGVPTESLYLSHSFQLQFKRDELLRLFALENGAGICSMRPARKIVEGGPLKSLIRRHRRNQRPLVDFNIKSSDLVAGP